MRTREYLMYCRECNEYTLLGKFVKEERRFQGEYSMLHNGYTENCELLCRFLLKHAGHTLNSVPNRTDEFTGIIQKGRRFMDRDIDRFVEDAWFEKQSERGGSNGLLPLYMLREMLKEEVHTISHTPTESSAASQFLLGKEEGIKQALASLDKLVDESVSNTP